MVALSRSFSQSAWIFLITLVTIIYRSAGKPLQLIICSQPDSFTVQITENQHVVYGTELLIRYNPHVGIFSYPEIKPVNVVFDETFIEFRGCMSLKDPMTQEYISSEKLSWNASGIILGNGTLQKLSKEDYAVQDCRLFLPTNVKSSTNLPKAIEEAIIYYIQFIIYYLLHSYAKKHLCKRIGTTKAEQLQNINRYEEYGYNIIRLNNKKIDLNINALIDIFLKKAINYAKQNGKSTIGIHNVMKTYNIGLGIKYYFETDNGIFADLSTLKRTEDAVISNIGRIYIIQAGFGLSTAKFKYNYYKLEVGLITINGSVFGTVDELTIKVKLVIDYDKICSVNLEYLKVTKLGKIELTMTGLSIINSLTSQVLTWLIRIWQDKIVEAIENNIKNVVEKQLREFIC